MSNIFLFISLSVKVYGSLNSCILLSMQYVSFILSRVRVISNPSSPFQNGIGKWCCLPSYSIRRDKVPSSLMIAKSNGKEFLYLQSGNLYCSENDILFSTNILRINSSLDERFLQPHDVICPLITLAGSAGNLFPQHPHLHNQSHCPFEFCSYGSINSILYDDLTPCQSLVLDLAATSLCKQPHDCVCPLTRSAFATVQMLPHSHRHFTLVGRYCHNISVTVSLPNFFPTRSMRLLLMRLSFVSHPHEVFLKLVRESETTFTTLPQSHRHKHCVLTLPPRYSPYIISNTNNLPNL